MKKQACIFRRCVLVKPARDDAAARQKRQRTAASYQSANKLGLGMDFCAEVNGVGLEELDEVRRALLHGVACERAEGTPPPPPCTPPPPRVHLFAPRPPSCSPQRALRPRPRWTSRLTFSATSSKSPASLPSTPTCANPPRKTRRSRPLQKSRTLQCNAVATATRAPAATAARATTASISPNLAGPGCG